MENCPRAREIANLARKLPVRVEREAYLHDVCGEDENLRAAVHELLREAGPGDGEDHAGLLKETLRGPGDEEFLLEEPEDLVAVANQLPAAEGRRYLEEVCGKDAEKLRQVEELMSVAPTVGEHTSGLREEGLGTTVDQFTILEKIGEGGYGVVYLAEQRQPLVRRVALKIIKLGMDTKQVIARFDIERQALAMMDHSNIAQVFDAGATESGRPYFAMELVEGIPVTRFCDQEQLGLRERMELFLQICGAIQHAHQKGVIHRDIKPSNVLVSLKDGVPVAKVIDFGVAKATQQKLTDKTLFTHGDQFVGTPVYASPEQADLTGLDIDTRSDVYSLGVLLYELLTGRTPFEAKRLLPAGLEEMLRIIREEDPPKPSRRIESLEREELATTASARKTESRQLRHEVRGDLDWIVMKALEKQRGRRYETADALRLDVRCYLENKPVSASPPSLRYRTSKFVRRHRVGVGAGTAIVATLVIATTVSVWEASEARKAELFAEAEQRKAERSVLMIGDAYQAANELAATMLLVGMADPEAGAGPLQRVMKKQGAAVASFYQDAEIRGEDAESRHMRAVVLSGRGYLARMLGNLEQSRQFIERALEIRHDLHRARPDKPLYLHNLAVSYSNLGDLHLLLAQREKESGPDYRAALEQFRKSHRYAESLRHHPEAGPYGRHDLAVSHFKIAEAVFQLSMVDDKLDQEEAMVHLERGYPIAKQLAASDPHYAKWQIDFGLYCFRIGEMHLMKDEEAEARSALKEGQSVFAQLRRAGRLTGKAAGYLERLEDLLRSIEPEPSR